jgi:DHA2 family multidrug resistance protein
VGPTLGGWITDNYTWGWCFYINVPIGVVSAFLVTGFLHDPPEQQRRSGPVDWLGIGLLIAGVGSLQYVLEEGNQDDWFASPLIRGLAALAAVSLSVLLWWQLSRRNAHPVIELRVLRNRQLAASIFLFVVLGFGLFGGAFLFPLFTQTLLGFTPTETGLAMLPGGLATAAFAMFCGVMLNGAKPKADARVLILCGMCLMLWSMWDLGHLTTAAGEADARYALIIRGAALGLLFAPINNVAFGSLRPSEAQQASGLINLSRQLGGSFGIAVLGTYLTRRTASHHADLVTNLYAGNPLLEQRLRGLTAGMLARGFDLAEAQQRAYALLEGQVRRQAAMLAYNDSWMLILGSFLVVIPAVFLLRRPARAGGGGCALIARHGRDEDAPGTARCRGRPRLVRAARRAATGSRAGRLRAHSPAGRRRSCTGRARASAARGRSPASGGGSPSRGAPTRGSRCSRPSGPSARAARCASRT